MSVTETLDQKKRDVFLSRASSRKELASTIHDLVIPELQRLGGNDKVSQQAITAIVAGIQAQGAEIVRLSQRLMALETMSFGARLRWAFTFATPQETNGASGTAAPLAGDTAGADPAA